MELETIPANQYGIDPRTLKAMQYRIERQVPRTSNVATFHFTLRDATTRGYEPFRQHTEASTGAGVYTEVNLQGKLVRINYSHSEYVFVHGDYFTELKESEEWPSVYVIDWVFTERAACNGAWWGNKHVEAGFAQMIKNLETIQKFGKWDLNSEYDDYEERPDLNIRIVNSFNADDAKEGIKVAVNAYKRRN
ncbi:hypothetical protein IMZ11_25285 [Microtetraspora sp. AC03309]|uniref:hypothetical protein n=1 Tax=Microtetraspora sp. AC03309 TaxID=2779376 RepID=UPI001E3A7560|nr:hypothetical protein [Microtetraspora sp. AC03309]MCC5578945.1 hypothetical protein [Microtetraspora sp. AC03309]